jgi:electron transfer flavoprotein alpha/beta subunit
MDVLVCVKRVPDTGGSITLTEDGMSVDATALFDPENERVKS